MSLLAPSAAFSQGSAPPAGDPPPLRIGPVILSGFIQTDAMTAIGDDLEETHDTFRIRRARLAFNGDVTPKIAWALNADFSGGSVSVRDAHFTLRFAEQFQMRVGQFYPALGLERLTSTTRLEVIDRTRLTDQLTYERNPGVAILNARPYKGWIAYNVGVFNGSGMNRTDDNDAKDVVGRIVVTPPFLRGLAVGVNGGSGLQLAGRRERLGLDVGYTHGPVKVTAEGLRESYENVADREGFILLGAYRLVPAVVRPHFTMAEVAVRFVQFDDPTFARAVTPTRSFIPPVTREFQFGGNYYVNRNVRFQANAAIPVDDRDTPRAVLIARLQVMY